MSVFRVTFPHDGEIVGVTIMANSKWEAIDKVYYAEGSISTAERSQYKCVTIRG